MGLAVALLLALQGVPTEPLVKKGTEYLKSQSAGLREGREFVLWTLVYVGTPKNDPVLQSLLKEVLAKPPESTRTAALQAMILEALDPLEHRTRIAHCAQFLVDNQCADGQWDDGRPVDPPELPPLPPEPVRPKETRDFDGPPRRKVEKLKILRKREGSATGDSVLSRWAAWGLIACHRAGMIPPEGLSEKAAAAWRSGEHDPADIVSALSCHRYLLGKDRKKDPDVLKAVERLADPARRNDPRSLFLLKRAMIHYDLEKLGGREWWPEGVKVLAAAQAPDGSWGGVEETCCAVFFLHVPRLIWPRDPDRR